MAIVQLTERLPRSQHKTDTVVEYVLRLLRTLTIAEGGDHTADCA